MGKSKSKIKVDISKLKQLQNDIDRLNNKQVQDFIEMVAKELAARLLAKVIHKTPVGQYPQSPGKKGGTLQRGWTTQQDGSGSEGAKGGNAKAYAETLKVNHYGGTYVVEIINPVNYASYVEFGHRTRGGDGWVEGQFMLTISEQELETDAPKVVERKLKLILGGLFE